MYALPGQTVEECVRDLEAALAYGTTHLSMYHLTLEPNTLFAKYPPALPDEDIAYEMQDIIDARTGEAGFRHYETSAYGKPHRRRGTTSITGVLAITSASGRARTASCRSRTGYCARCGTNTPPPTCARRWPATPCRSHAM